MNVHKDDLGFDLLQQFVSFAERVVIRGHEYAPLQVDNSVGHVVLASFVNSVPWQAGRIVCRPQQPACRTVRVAICRREVINDFALVPDVIAGGHHINSELEKIFGQRWSDAEARGGVFAVRQHEVNAVFTDQALQPFADDVPPRPPKDVANEENFHAVSMVSNWRGALAKTQLLSSNFLAVV